MERDFEPSGLGNQTAVARRIHNHQVLPKFCKPITLRFKLVVADIAQRTRSQRRTHHLRAVLWRLKRGRINFHPHICDTVSILPIQLHFCPDAAYAASRADFAQCDFSRRDVGWPLFDVQRGVVVEGARKIEPAARCLLSISGIVGNPVAVVVQPGFLQQKVAPDRLSRIFKAHQQAVPLAQPRQKKIGKLGAGARGIRQILPGRRRGNHSPCFADALGLFDETARKAGFVEDIDAHARSGGLQLSQPAVQVVRGDDLPAHTIQVEFVGIPVVDHVDRDRPLNPCTLFACPGCNRIAHLGNVPWCVSVGQKICGNQVDVSVFVAPFQKEVVDVGCNLVDVALQRVSCPQPAGDEDQQPRLGRGAEVAHRQSVGLRALDQFVVVFQPHVDTSGLGRFELVAHGRAERRIGDRHHRAVAVCVEPNRQIGVVGVDPLCVDQVLFLFDHIEVDPIDVGDALETMFLRNPIAVNGLCIGAAVIGFCKKIGCKHHTRQPIPIVVGYPAGEGVGR